MIPSDLIILDGCHNWTKKTKSLGRVIFFPQCVAFSLPLIGRTTLTSNRIWKRKQTGKAGSSKFFLANFVCSLAKEGSGITSHLMTNYVTDISIHLISV